MEKNREKRKWYEGKIKVNKLIWEKEREKRWRTR